MNQSHLPLAEAGTEHLAACFLYMNMQRAEAPEERRARFLRLAIAAAVTAAKVPLPQVREAYLRLARHLRAEADQTGEDNEP
jgi:hypothetical protein